MKRFLTVLLFLLCVVALFLLPGAVSAKTSGANTRVPQQRHKPQDVFATNKVEWAGGTNYGAQTFFGTSFPGLPDNQCQYTLHRYLQVIDTNSGESNVNASLLTGIYDLPKGCQIPIYTGQAGNCNLTFAANTLVFVIATESIDGLFETCDLKPVPNGLINKDVQYNTWGADNSGNNAKVSVYSCAVTPCFSWSKTFSCAGTMYCYDPEYSNVLMSQTINLPLCSGHCVWGINWYNNYWANGNHQLNPQSSPSPGSNPPFTCVGGSLNGCPSTTVPNGFVYYWTIGAYPSQSSSGGFAHACFYESYPANYPYCLHNA